MNKKLIAEMAFIKHLLTDVYPDNSFSYVADSYDYWAVVSEVMSEPCIKNAVMNHNGFIGIRGDSGNPVDIICGNPNCKDDICENMGTVEILWNIYGGTINSKGYKVLDKHIKVVYGDSITPERAEEIYRRLKEKGFAANNVSLGMGSYSMQSCEGNTPMTRDTYSIAVKSTYGELKNGESFEIFKNPKTDNGHFKKSQRGCCVVYKDEDGNITYEDNMSYDEAKSFKGNMLIPVFCNGELLKDYTLKEIRYNLYGEEFEFKKEIVNMMNLKCTGYYWYNKDENIVHLWVCFFNYKPIVILPGISEYIKENYNDAKIKVYIVVKPKEDLISKEEFKKFLDKCDFDDVFNFSKKSYNLLKYVVNNKRNELVGI